MNEYKKLLSTIPDNQLTEVKMNDGTIIKCKKIPIASIESMSSILTGLKDGLNLTAGALNYIASCGNIKLYSAVGDVSSYMRNSQGNILSASVGSNGKITGQPGFQEVGLTQGGIKAASTIAKAIPWVAIAVTIIEIGTKIVMNQQKIKADQIAFYDKQSEINEDSINDLWQVINDYSLSKQDDAHRTSDLVIVKTAFNKANNSFIKLSKDASKRNKINDHLVYAMKTALDVYSFAYLLKIMYANVEDCSEYVESALNDISEKTKLYDEIYDKCYQQYLESGKKQDKILKNTQYNNADKSTKTILKRVGADLLTGGVAEIGSLSSKGIGKKIQGNQKDVMVKLDACKQNGNPFVDCIGTAGELLLLKKPLLRDDKYLYYEAD